MRKIFIAAAIAISLLGAGMAHAQYNPFANATNMAQNTAKPAGLDTGNKLSIIVADMIQVLLGFVGIMFFLYALWAGYVWMTSQGSEEKIKKAKAILLNASIGIFLVLMAYSITYFISTTFEKVLP